MGAKWPGIAVLMENVFRKTFSACGVLYDGIHKTSTWKTWYYTQLQGKHFLWSTENKPNRKKNVFRFSEEFFRDATSSTNHHK